MQFLSRYYYVDWLVGWLNGGWLYQPYICRLRTYIATVFIFHHSHPFTSNTKLVIELIIEAYN